MWVVEQLRVRDRPVDGDDRRERERAGEIRQRVVLSPAQEDDDERRRGEQRVRELHGVATLNAQPASARRIGVSRGESSIAAPPVTSNVESGSL